MKPTCLIIAGETSGEEHALSFMGDLKKKSPETHFFGVGGNLLKDEGVELLYHLDQFSTWGYSEVIAKLPFYKKAMDKILNEVVKRNCKVAILIDYQSFNLKLAVQLKKLNVSVLYYVAPQAWAWKEYRVLKLKKSIHTLFTIIPFEKKWFENRGIANVISIDHPLWQTYKNELANFKACENFNEAELQLLLLPGSRNSEVKNLLPEFIKAVIELKKFFNLKVLIVKSKSVNEELYKPYNSLFNEVYYNEELVSTLKKADFVIAASGTVTLTCALFEVPTIVCYKVSLLNQFIFENFVNYKGHISLANIIHNKLVFPELLQDKVTYYNIVSQIKFWYYNKNEYKKLKEELAHTKILVQGGPINIPEYMNKVIQSTYGNIVTIKNI